NLYDEGMGPGRAVLTGDVHYDLFLLTREKASAKSAYPACLDLAPGEYHLATIHRAENTSSPERVKEIFAALAKSEQPVVMPLHLVSGDCGERVGPRDRRGYWTARLSDQRVPPTRSPRGFLRRLPRGGKNRQLDI